MSIRRIFKSATLILLGLFVIAGCSKSETPAVVVVANKAPVANAGASQVITLPVNSVTLAGAGADADGTVVTYLWSQVSGPGASAITNPGSATTAVNGLIAGSYIFQLMVTDNGGLSGVDTMTVLVNPAPAPVTMTLQPANNPTERLIAVLGTTDQSAGGKDHWPIEAWTVSGNNYTTRIAVKFDISGIPSTATVTSATLYLYSNTPPEDGNLTDANFGTNNSMYVQQITSAWSNSTTWTAPPTTTTTNQVSVAATTSSTLDLTIDLTNMVKTMVSTSSNNGFLLKLQNETTYNNREFVGSFNTSKATKYPKLVVTYTP